ncbi:MAG: glycoside hydrolase family protein [PVC group bacterium]|nr:glycoside hydrolase family protein [PVC group bacterium]
MNTDDIVDMIKKHEGLSLTVYNDTEGIPTVGYGHALHPGSKIPIHVANALFNQDFWSAYRDYEKLGLDLDPVRKAVVIDMLFNLGWKRFHTFKKMIAALREGDYETAAKEMLDSKWKNQVGDRAVRLARMMERGYSFSHS